MTKREKELLKIIDDILWMAIRYAHGRHTYAPGVVRYVVKALKSIYPNYILRKDDTIKPPKKSEIKGVSFKKDYLHDLFEE